MKADDKEQKSGTAATLSCAITDLSAAAVVVWSKTDAADLLSVTGYTVAQGAYSSSAKTQTSTLALTGAVNAADQMYLCKATPDGGTEGEVGVMSYVFGRLKIKE